MPHSSDNNLDLPSRPYPFNKTKPSNGFPSIRHMLSRVTTANWSRFSAPGRQPDGAVYDSSTPNKLSAAAPPFLCVSLPHYHQLQTASWASSSKSTSPDSMSTGSDILASSETGHIYPFGMSASPFQRDRQTLQADPKHGVMWEVGYRNSNSSCGEWLERMHSRLQTDYCGLKKKYEELEERLKRAKMAVVWADEEVIFERAQTDCIKAARVTEPACKRCFSLEAENRSLARQFKEYARCDNENDLKNRRLYDSWSEKLESVGRSCECGGVQKEELPKEQLQPCDEEVDCPSSSSAEKENELGLDENSRTERLRSAAKGKQVERG